MEILQEQAQDEQFVKQQKQQRQKAIMNIHSRLGLKKRPANTVSIDAYGADRLFQLRQQRSVSDDRSAKQAI